MAIFTKQFLSGSTEGQPILIAATATPGTTVHTPQDSPTMEEVWIYAVNNDTLDVTLTIEFGGSTEDIITDIPAQEGLLLIVPGQPIQNSANIIRAFASTTNEIGIFGWVNRIE